MGLGKTVMLIALLLLHRYEKPGTAPQSNKEIIPSASTLVITPSAILEQWVSELGRHAPSLGVTVYDGNESVSPTDLSSYDIVLTTYDTLRKDLNAAMPDNERPRRHARAHPRRKSPLMGLHWFRVVLDEAQMVESSVNKAAKMARMLPRVHPWAVTGTPIGKNGWNDLRGLISFLGIEPFTSYKHIWNRLTNPVHRLRLIDVLRRFMHRNLKRDLRSELTLPPQHENTLHLDFSRVERTWYNQQFDEMMDAVQEARTSQEKEELAGKLRGWLLQLRQTCCHPQVGTRNRSVLGGTLRSIDEVLDVMHKQTNNQILLYERQIVQARINKAQLLEFKSKADEWANAATVVGIYETTLQQVRRVIKDLEEHIAETEKKQSQLSSASDNQDDAFEIDENDEMSRKGDMDTQSDLREDLQSATGHLRTWQELEHRVTYFLACLFHSIGDEASENKGYIEAEEVRLRILRPVIEDVTKMIERFRAYTRGLDEKMAASRRTRLADTNLPHAGFVIGNALSGLDDLSGKLEGQWDEIMSWRKVIVDALLAPLNETSVESLIASGNKEPPSVEEYQKGVDTQSRADVYQAAYQLALADRRQLLTGFRVSEERSTAVTENEKDKELRLQLEQTKKQFVLPFGALPAKDLVAELKKLEQRDLPAIEKRMLSNALQGLPKAVEKEIANLTLLEREVHAFSKLFNLRVGYFRHLQRISDGVVPLEEPPMKEIDEDLKKLDPHEAEVQQLLVNQLSRKRYLQNLMKEERERANAVEKTWECLVCKTAFTEGVVTPCGHIYCAECSAAWIKRYRKCPLCNQPVQVTQCTPVSLRGTLSNPASQSASSSSTGSNSGTTNGDVGGSSATEQSSANYILLGHLANIPLKGSYGTKLDTLIRHLRYLRLIDPTAKSLVFSQWEHVLDILSEGLTRNGIEFVKLEKSRSKNKRDALKRFRDDNDVEVFMLNARSQSSGLTLVSANHVFLVEPVVNIGLEEQAIGRVHRIGQTRETTVWRYIVRGTVEERVHAVGRAARRRLVAEQLQRDNGGGKSPVFEEEDVEVNVRMVGLENRTGGGGEQVGMRDVRYCLFGEGMNLSELEEEADGTPDISSPAGPGEDNTPMEVAPTSILTLPVELDDEAKAYVTSLQKKTWGDILEDDDSPIVPVTKGRGRMGRKRHIVDRTALLR
ncbi:SNF2 family N-terminal domain-containing protein [Fimicolochytrium jonesii]|uniref:SNF2 family N-terminal domain-containing protein n=1 Tax=Fimicolochytrium jonesii TaxID=1396493 RepID=UPI0022FE7705|nr:SNF2 family N-terminal domain-containing protein [Fimicolochytrium jonesii]KAI8816717.1 SNF2 family N-terminal domain-containing protein [Fimicolochytrium jonesii]